MCVRLSKLVPDLIRFRVIHESSCSVRKSAALERQLRNNFVNQLIDWMDRAPRQAWLVMSAGCVAMLVFGMYLQHVVGLEPCPMCIVQRYALILVALSAALAGATGIKGLQIAGAGLVVGFAGFGAFVAARQTWLQWYPPEVATCGRDFYGMIEAFPLQRVIPMLFKGTGDCSKIDWTFLGGTIANWSFVCFCLLGLASLVLVWRRLRKAAEFA